MIITTDASVISLKLKLKMLRLFAIVDKNYQTISTLFSFNFPAALPRINIHGTRLDFTSISWRI